MRYPVILLLLFSVLSGASDLYAQKQEKKYPSLLWEITGNGLQKPSYLYGTMHVSRKLAFHLSDTFFLAIKSVDVVALELDMESWMEENVELDRSEMMSEYAGYYSTPSGFYKKGLQISSPDNDDLKNMLKSTPGMINHMLYRSSGGRNTDFEEDTYLDHFLFQAGRKLGKKVVGLEDFEVSRKLVNKSADDDLDDDDENAQEEKERKRLLLKDLEKDMSFSEIMEDAYRRGDLDLLDSLQELYFTSLNYHKYMLHERNVIMANRMDSIMKRSRLFAGMGAAHLAGEMGVITLLRKLGYTLRPVSFSNTNGTKLKSAIDQMRVPVNFTKQFSSDSLFSADFPAPVFETYTDASTKYYLALDMGNGSYYYVQRIRHFGGLTGQNQDYLMKRLDSLLFENIPGKIISKKDIRSNNGWPGIDVVNKTAKGDHQRYRIYISPEEFFVFKIGATEDYVITGKEADLFFNSIQFQVNSGKTDNIYKDPSHGIALKFPSSVLVNDVYSRKSPQHAMVSSSDGSGNYYFLTYASLEDFNYIEEDTFELNMIAEVFAKQHDVKIESTSHGTFKGFPGLRVVYKQNERTIYGQLVLRGASYYFFGAVTTGPGKAGEFINGFSFTERTLVTPMKDYVDTNMFFSVKTHINETRYADLVKEKASPGPLSKKEKKDLEEKLFLPVSKTRYYSSAETGEKIYVEYRKFSMFYQDNSLEEFWKVRIDDLEDINKMRFKEISRTTSDKGSTLTGQLSDTNSIRAIYVKMMQRCGVVYTLKATMDSISGPSPFVEGFFKSFTPKDTCIGADITSDKLSEYFFPNVFSSDTTVKNRAGLAMKYVAANLKPHHADQMIKLISDPRFPELATNYKQLMIEALGKIKTRQVLDFLSTLYVKYTDSLALEFSVLYGVSRMRTVESAKVFLSLLKKEMPVTSETSPISNAFAPFMDTVNVGRILFPDILAFARFPEYRNVVYNLLAKCVKNNVVKRSDYSKWKSSILDDANYELKKYMATSEDDSEPLSGKKYNFSSYKKASTYSPSDELTIAQGKIFNYVVILAPFHADKKVQEFFGKVMRTRLAGLKIMVAGHMLSQGVPVNDTLWNHYGKNRVTKAYTYWVLSYYKRLDKLGPLMNDQTELVKSLLYNEEIKGKNKGDTVVFLEKILVQVKKDKGYVYVFKARSKDKKIWKLGLSGIHPLNGQVDIVPEVNRNSISFESEQQMKKEIETTLRKLRIEGRKRATSSDFEKGTSYSYLYDDY